VSTTIPYRHITLFASPHDRPDSEETAGWGVCFSNDPNDQKDRLWLRGFDTAWGAWEFVFATTGLDIRLPLGVVSERMRRWIYEIPDPEEEKSYEQLPMFAGLET
jgi:hypothetical protein